MINQSGIATPFVSGETDFDTHFATPGEPFGYAIIGEVAFSVEPPASEPPPLQIVRNAEGDVTVTFGGILESASVPNDEFTPVSGAPQGTYTIPANELTTQRYFRARVD